MRTATSRNGRSRPFSWPASRPALASRARGNPALDRYRHTFLAGRPGKGPVSGWSEDAELVALRVGQARPRDVALAEVDVGGAECSQPRHLHRLIVTGVGPEVEMD